MVHIFPTIIKLEKVIIYEIFSLLSTNIKKTEIEDIQITKLRVDENIKYALEVKKKYIENEQFTHTNYIKHKVLEEEVDYNYMNAVDDLGGVEDVDIKGYEKFAYIYYWLNEEYNEIAQSIMNSGFYEYKMENVENIKNTKLCHAIQMYIYYRKELLDLVGSIQEYIGNHDFYLLKK